MSAALDRLLRERRLLVCVGPGGVGKTTAAAALGVRAALLGVSTLVLTVDPARRLATALGLDGLGDAAQAVPLAGLTGLEVGGASLGAAGPRPARLDAAMLEVGDAHDAFIRRVAAPAAAERIFANRVYRLTSRTLGATHAYAAIERLGDALAAGDHQLVILDTPPTRNALDILDAPGRLLRFLDEGAVAWLVGHVPEDSREDGAPGRLGAGGDLVARAARRLLARLAGASVVAELGEFLGLFVALRPAFVGRAQAVEAALRAEDAAFVLITSPLADNLADARSLAAGLTQREVRPAALLINRAYTPAPIEVDDDEARLEALAPAASTSPGERARFAELLAATAKLRERCLAGRTRAFADARAFAADLGVAALALAPQSRCEPQDVVALADLAASILDA